MSEHHPDAAGVMEWVCDGDDVAPAVIEGHVSDLLAALTAAGLAVVRVGDVPPWMKPAIYSNGTEPMAFAGRTCYVVWEQP
jgi:hypothetical protein